MANSKEIDVRDEVERFFNGDDFGTEKFHVLLQRKIRIDTDKYPYINKIKCNTCNHDYNNSGTVGCPSCDGVGYLWDEKLIVGYMYRPQQIRLSDQYSNFSQIGRNDSPSFILITPKEYRVALGDYVYSIDTTDDGGIHMPLIKTNKYLAVSSIPMRLDKGKLEFNSMIVSEVH